MNTRLRKAAFKKAQLFNKYSCDGCDAWTHARCSDSVSVRQYDRLVQQQATFNYLCNACLISKLPFTDTQDDEADVDVSLDSSDD